MSANSNATLLEHLRYARQLVEYAERLGIAQSKPQRRQPYQHLGAVLADGILQSGLNYRSVVQPRITRIIERYPDTANLPPLLHLSSGGKSGEYLAWSGKTKIRRFEKLVSFFSDEEIINVIDLHSWLTIPKSRFLLLGMEGVGPKTFDYICCLAGLDCIAVDRHVRTFACEAGVFLDEYEDVQTVVSFAADILGFPRREFDAWIWKLIATTDQRIEQLQLI